MKGFLIGVVVTAVAFAVLAYFIPQIKLGDEVIQYLALGAVVGVVNAFIKPIIRIEAQAHARLARSGPGR